MKFAYLWRHKPGGVTFEKKCQFPLWHTVSTDDGIMMLHTQPATYTQHTITPRNPLPTPYADPTRPHKLTQPTHPNFPPKMIIYYCQIDCWHDNRI